MAEIIAKLASAAASKAVRPDEKPSCNFCTVVCSSQMELSHHLINEHFKGLIGGGGGSSGGVKCQSCPRSFASQDQLESHVKSVHRAKHIRRTLGLEPERLPAHFRLKPGPKRAKLQMMAQIDPNYYLKDSEDAHQKETDELRPSLLAARSDAAAAAKEAQQKAKMEEEEQKKQDLLNQQELEEVENEAAMDDDQPEQLSDDLRYEPITEDFLFEDNIISPCYVVLPYVTQEEVEAACDEPIEENDALVVQDYGDEEAPLTIDESIVDEEPELPKSPIRSSELIPDEILRAKSVYNAEDR